MRARWGGVAGIGAALALGAGCGTEGLAFVVDDRLEITAPDDRAEVAVPFTVAWTVEDLDAPRFAVFVDRAPPRPGREVDPEARDVYVTSERSVVIERVPDQGADAAGELHEATVVLVDGQGRRIGESAFAVRFRIEDEG